MTLEAIIWDFYSILSFLKKIDIKGNVISILDVDLVSNFFFRVLPTTSIDLSFQVLAAIFDFQARIHKIMLTYFKYC